MAVKVIFISEDEPNGIVADWPFVPRVGDDVTFAHKGGTSAYRVGAVTWECDTSGNLKTVKVDLTY